MVSLVSKLAPSEALTRGNYEPGAPHSLVAHLGDPASAEWATNLVQDLGTEASLCELILKGISNCAWKPKKLMKPAVPTGRVRNA